jgi:integrase
MDLGITSGDILASSRAFEKGAGSDEMSETAATFGAVALRYITLSEPRWGAYASATTKSVIRKHLIADLGHLPVDKLTATEIRTFVEALVQSNASSSLLRKAVTHLRGILDLAQESGMLRLNPMRSRAFKVDYHSRKAASVRHLSYQECGSLLAELSGRDRLIIRMFIQLGLRPKELFVLRLDDVKSEFIRIDEVLLRGRVQKIMGETALRVYVPPDLLSELERWLASEPSQTGDWLFPASRSSHSGKRPPLSQDNFRNRVLKPAAKRAGVREVDFVALRRTCASFFAQVATAQDALAQLRHHDPAVTAEPGAQSVPESLKRAGATIEAEILHATKQAERTTGRGALTAMP